MLNTAFIRLCTNLDMFFYKYIYAGLPDAVFAAAVPRSWSRNLAELIHDVTEDHAKMQARKAQAALEAAQRDAAGIDREDGI